MPMRHCKIYKRSPFRPVVKSFFGGSEVTNFSIQLPWLPLRSFFLALNIATARKLTSSPPEKWWESWKPEDFDFQERSVWTSFWEANVFSHQNNSALEIGETSHPKFCVAKTPRNTSNLQERQENRLNRLLGAPSEMPCIIMPSKMRHAKQKQLTSWESKGTSTSPMPPLPRSKNGFLTYSANFKWKEGASPVVNSFLLVK